MICSMITVRLQQLVKSFVLLILGLVFPYIVITYDVITLVDVENFEVSFSDPNYLVKQEFMVVQTGFYYNTSSFYPNNTAVVIFFADHRQNATDWTCRSSNSAETLSSNALVRRVSNFSIHCHWMTHFLTCPTVLHPTMFQLTVNNASEAISIPLEPPDRRPRDIVSCFAPMFYEQRWQTIIFIHEIYAAWGVDLQVHYVQSAVGDILNLLDSFVQRGLLEVRGLDITDFGPDLVAKFGYNPAQATAARHQVMSHQDCFFRYRESAEFIMISDIDDVFLPLHGKGLYDEFKYWKNLNPMASAFLFGRNESYIQTSGKMEGFSLVSALKSIEIEAKQIDGKSVYNPMFTETPWMHWPGLNVTPVFNVPPAEGYSLHLKYAYDEASNITEPTVNIANIIDVTSLFNETVIDFGNATTRFPDLPDRSLDYADLIHTCKLRLRALYSYPSMSTLNIPCTTATSCDYGSRNVNCSIAIRKYNTNCIQPTRLCAIIPTKVLPDMVTRSNGCAWGNFDNHDNSLNANSYS